MTPTNLLSLIGERPKKHHSLDRKDSKGHYSCGTCNECVKMGYAMNVQWATPSEQAHNRKDNVWITINGERKTCYDWAKHFGRSYHWVRDHYKADEPTT